MIGEMVKWTIGARYPVELVGVVVAASSDGVVVRANGNSYAVDRERLAVVATCKQCGRPLRRKGLYCSTYCFGRARKGTADEIVFAAVVAHKTKHDGLSPTLRQLERATRLDVTPIINALRRLEEAGRISIIGKGRHRDIMVTGGRWVYEPEEGNE